MKKIDIVLFSVFAISLVAFSIIWGTIFAQDISTPTVPLAPSNLVLNGTPTTTSISLSWTDNSNNEDKFNIERKLTTATYWTGAWSTQITTANTTSYINSGLTSGTAYDYRVQACLSGTGCSEWTYLINVSTVNESSSNTASTTNSTTCTSLVLTLNDGKTSYIAGENISYTWTCSPGGIAANVFVRLYKPDNTSNQYNSSTNLGTSSNSFGTSNLTAGAYVLKACLDSTCTTVAANQPFSITVPTTSSGSGDSSGNTSTTPLAPTNLVATVNGGNVTLTWVDNSSNEVGFKIYRGPTWTDIGNVGTNITTFVDSFRPAGTYTYRLNAFNSSYMYSGLSNDVTAVVVSSITGTTTTNTTTTTTNTTTTSGTSNTNTTSSTAPLATTSAVLAPSNLSSSGTPTSTSISLRWADNSNNEDKFNIERKLTTGTYWTGAWSTQLTTANTTSYTNTGLTPGTAYDYRVQACLSGTGCSEWTYLIGVSTLASATTTSNTTEVKPTTITQITNTEKEASFVVTPLTTPVAPTAPISTENKIIPVSVPIIKTEFSRKTETLVSVVEERKNAVNESKEQLMKIINDSFSDLIKDKETPVPKKVGDKVNNLREELLKKVDSSLITLTTITPEDIDKLKTEVGKGINEMKVAAGEKVVEATEDPSLKNLNETLVSLSETVEDQSKMLKNTDADLLYKDSNKDGISDYEAVHVYDMNPRAPAIVSSYEGRSINAAEKILLGFDPTKTEIVKVEKEYPVEALTPVVETYKVNEVALTETKAVVLKGQALPNTFITIYIYSTPIIVTVKTDSNGEWQYTLDKELENGDHTVYTASVNNSGNIVAKSTPFLFTKTAEAASLKDTLTPSPTDTGKPSLLESNNIYIQMFVFIVVILLVISLLIIIGMPSKKSKDVV